jgi:hypothetical protein
MKVLLNILHVLLGLVTGNGVQKEVQKKWYITERCKEKNTNYYTIQRSSSVLC